MDDAQEAAAAADLRHQIERGQDWLAHWGTDEWAADRDRLAHWGTDEDEAVNRFAERLAALDDGHLLGAYRDFTNTIGPVMWLLWGTGRVVAIPGMKRARPQGNPPGPGSGAVRA